MLTRSTSEKKKTKVAPAQASASSPGTWSRARVWLDRLLRRKAPQPEHRTPRRTSVLDKSEVELVRHHLAEVLDQHPQARKVMRYVMALEHALRKKGRFALDDLPIDVIRRALEQLDQFVVDWTPEGLATLRSKAAVAIADRERVDDERRQRREANETDVEVEEASVTKFLEVNEEWERSFTGNTDRGALDEAGAAPAEQAGADKPA